MPKISFIIPVYKMERYLNKLFESLSNQSFTDFEAILVDDGSPDKSGEMCDEFQKADSRFKVIHQKNGGVAKARNTALDESTGDYILFLDPDDWMESDSAEFLINKAEKENADIVMFGIFNDYCLPDGSVVKTTISNPALVGVFRGEPFKEHFDKIATSHLSAGKLLRRSIIEEFHIRFKEHSLGEDGMFFVDFYRNNPKCLVCVDKPLYHYLIARDASLTNSYHPERVNQNFYLSNAIKNVLEEWQLTDSQIHQKTAKYCTVRDLQLGIKNISLSPLTGSERLKWLKNVMKDKWVKASVRDTDISACKSRNDKIKLLLLKMHLYNFVLWISDRNQNQGKKGKA